MNIIKLLCILRSRIQRRFLFQENDSVSQLLHEEIGLVEDLAVDWTTGNVYFTLNAMNTDRESHVAMIGKEGGNKVTLVTSGVHKPRGIALHPLNKLVVNIVCDSNTYIIHTCIQCTNILAGIQWYYVGVC